MNHSSNDSDIATIAMVGRFPGANDLETFWGNLREGKESISFFSKSELANSGIRDEILNDSKYVRAHGILQSVDLFDHHFFGMASSEAAIIDPQQRLFLQCAVEAIETAGYNPDTYHGLIGVYAGVSTNTYLYNNLYSNIKAPTTSKQFQIMVANDKDYLSTRVSYKLNLKGPSYTVQTACSTSLVAIHQACQGLLSGECDMALAGGVTIKLPQVTGYLYEEGMIFSPDGHVRSFDAKANGTVLGNGIGIVVLKPLKDAMDDGDTILAVIKGSATNNDGSFKASYAAPSKDGQARVIEDAQAVANINAETISYVEAHATGTILGDSVEVSALTQAFQKTTSKKGFCAIGSVKTNIGHLDSAAGVVGFIKTVLMLKNKLLVPSLNYETANPSIDFTNSPFYVCDQLTQWKSNGGPRRAGVSSFGIGGTNAHLIVEEAPLPKPSGVSIRKQIVTLSAKTSSALDQATDNIAKYLKQNHESNTADVAFSLNIGRREYRHRKVFICPNSSEARDIFNTNNKELSFSNIVRYNDRSLVFLFPGEITDYVNMATELHKCEPVFRDQVRYCCKMTEPELGFDIYPLLYPDSKDQKQAPFTQKTAIAQTALFIFEYALSQLWISWGIKPHAMAGHGIGEYVAACLAKVISLQDALSLVIFRDSLLALDSSNSANLGKRVKSFAEKIKTIRLKAPQISYISSTTATWITADQATDPSYWSTQLISKKINFKDTIRKLLDDNCYILLEVGWEESLTSLIRQQHGENTHKTLMFSSFKGKQKRTSETEDRSMENILSTLGQLWLAGLSVNWGSFYAKEQRHRIPLPTYPFARERHWIGSV